MKSEIKILKILNVPTNSVRFFLYLREVCETTFNEDIFVRLQIRELFKVVFVFDIFN